MEKYSKQTRFILSCNYPNKVIAPIRDRCAFSGSRFRPIPSEAICEALKAIVEQEGLDIAPDALKAVGEASNGSMRSALNLLFSATRIPVRVEVEDVRELTNEISETGLKQLLGLAIESNKHDVGDAQYLKAHRRLDSMIEMMGEKGMNGVEILDAFHSLVQNDSNVPNKLRRAIYKHIGEAIYWCSISQDDLLTVKTFLRRITV
jgi:replication factor C small subunit